MRERLLQSALGLLQTQGFAALTQSRVAEAAGVRQSHLTYYFPTRTDLLKAVVEASAGALVEMMAGGGKPSLAKVRDVLLATARERRMPRLMLALVMASEEDPSLKAWLRAFERNLIDRLLGTLQRAGLDVTVEEVQLFHATMAGAAVLSLKGDDSDAEVATRTARMVDLALERLAASSSARMPKGS